MMNNDLPTLDSRPHRTYLVLETERTWTLHQEMG